MRLLLLIVFLPVALAAVPDIATSVDVAGAPASPAPSAVPAHAALPPRWDARVSAVLTLVGSLGDDAPPHHDGAGSVPSPSPRAASTSHEVLLDTGSHVTWLPSPRCAHLSVRALRDGQLAVEARAPCPRAAAATPLAADCTRGRSTVVRYADDVRVIGVVCAANVSLNGGPPFPMSLMLADEVSVPVSRGGEVSAWPMGGDGVIGLAPHAPGGRRPVDMNALRSSGCAAAAAATVLSFAPRRGGDGDGVTATLGCATAAAAAAAPPAMTTCVRAEEHAWKFTVPAVRLVVGAIGGASTGGGGASASGVTLHFDTGATHTAVPAWVAGDLDAVPQARTDVVRDGDDISLVVRLPSANKDLRIPTIAADIAPILSTSSSQWVIGGRALLRALPHVQFTEHVNGTAYMCFDLAALEEAGVGT
jgi:hypothetical protein